MKLLRIMPRSLCPSISWRYLELPKITATGIVGAYGGPVYLSTVSGGWIADRLLGMERAVLYGGVGVMCVPTALPIIRGLAVSALGSGALKANASSLLGTLYAKGDARCDGGFTLFYLGINLGAFIGPLITGLLQTHAGFHSGFGAAVGIALGLAWYVAFRRNLRSHGRTVPNRLPRSAIGWVVGIAVVGRHRNRGIGGVLRHLGATAVADQLIGDDKVCARGIPGSDEALYFFSVGETPPASNSQPCQPAITTSPT